MDKYHIPQNLDMPFKVILWTWDEITSFGAPFLFLFLTFNAPMTGLVVGALFVVALKKIKGEEGHYFVAHLAYWYFPPFVFYKATPASYIREILG